MFTERISSSPSFWQSALWEAILHDSGQTRDVEVITYGMLGIMVEYRHIGMGFQGAFSLGVDMSLYSPDFILRVRQELSKKGVLFWQIEEYDPKGKDQSEVSLETYGRSFIEPLTRVLDILPSEEEIMTQMHEKGRYNIRLAWKRGVVTEWVKPTVENIDIWMGLLSETTERDSFSHNSREYYISFLRNIIDSNSGGLLFASLDGKVIAAGIFVYHHRVGIYYYGASTSDSEMRKHMAPYMIQWEGIREGKLRGCHTYDLLGVSPSGDTLHHLAGVSAFKEKFGGKVISVGSKFLFIISPVRYTFFLFIRWVRRKLKK